MSFIKVLPIIPFLEFSQRASAVKEFGGATNVRYLVDRAEKDFLFIRRLDAKNNEHSQRLYLRNAYDALQQLTEFNTVNFRRFTRSMHSPARALLAHLALIVQTDQEKIVFFNTGWMTAYRGLVGDTLQGGGKYVKEHGFGSEIFNFLPYRGRLYGYVQPKIDNKYGNDPTIRIEKLGAAPEDDFVDGITVVWTAKDPTHGGTRIIGWYKNARVYRYHRPPTELSNRRHEGQLQGYYAEAKEEDCVLLPIDARKVEIFRQQKSWMGQSNVWYAEDNQEFVRQVAAYIAGEARPELTSPASSRKKTEGSRQPDVLKRLAVEKAAVTCVCDYYSGLGYVVNSVEKDNEGWDLTATDHETMLRLEVKGLSGGAVITELTPNEYEKAKFYKAEYRICVVTNALNKPFLQIFSYSAELDGWSDLTGVMLTFEERTSARVSI
jgi:hypothetical protein